MKNTLTKLICSTALLASFVPMMASAALTAVGPASKANGFPAFYQDSNGMKLGLCLNAKVNCGALEGVRTTRAVKFPTNFPTEAFFWSAETDLATNTGGTLKVVMALEAGFTGAKPRAGTRATFSRIRIRGFDLPVGTYKVTHPFGEKTFTVTTPTGRGINFTNDVGLVKQNFNGCLQGDIGPFLTWDPAIPPAAPAGFIGDAATPHKVTGSPSGNNFVRIEKVEKDGLFEVGFTDEFTVTGSIAK